MTTGKSVQLFHCVWKIAFFPDDAKIWGPIFFARKEKIGRFYCRLCICSGWRGPHLPRINLLLLLSNLPHISSRMIFEQKSTQLVERKPIYDRLGLVFLPFRIDSLHLSLSRSPNFPHDAADHSLTPPQVFPLFRPFPLFPFFQRGVCQRGNRGWTVKCGLSKEEDKASATPGIFFVVSNAHSWYHMIRRSMEGASMLSFFTVWQITELVGSIKIKLVFTFWH